MVNGAWSCKDVMLLVLVVRCFSTRRNTTSMRLRRMRSKQRQEEHVRPQSLIFLGADAVSNVPFLSSRCREATALLPSTSTAFFSGNPEAITE